MGFQTAGDQHGHHWVQHSAGVFCTTESFLHPPLWWGPAFHSPQLSALAYLTLLLLVYQNTMVPFGSSPPLSFLKSIYPQGGFKQTHPAWAGSLCCGCFCSLLWILFLAPPDILISSFSPVISFDLKLSLTPLNLSWCVLGHVIYCTSWTTLNPWEGPVHQEFLEVNSKLLLFKPVRVTLSSSSILSWEP